MICRWVNRVAMFFLAFWSIEILWRELILHQFPSQIPKWSVYTLILINLILIFRWVKSSLNWAPGTKPNKS